MIKGTSFVPVTTLQKFIEDVFAGLGVPPADAKTIADVLITSDVRGIDLMGSVV